ncbi:hypothetical protein FNF27_01352 [Cafeteria roenbergensis]|uniref:Uncharacterized protein n=1 Tax=Cafeteria roenbergensis TaxID=33653 RepID=A0A5A8EHK0_CAFRO|nr:hypothetical protein FNF27_01352 [Cafeteria roenbergensis]
MDPSPPAAWQAKVAQLEADALAAASCGAASLAELWDRTAARLADSHPRVVENATALFATLALRTRPEDLPLATAKAVALDPRGREISGRGVSAAESGSAARATRGTGSDDDDDDGEDGGDDDSASLCVPASLDDVPDVLEVAQAAPFGSTAHRRVSRHGSRPSTAGVVRPSTFNAFSKAMNAVTMAWLASAPVPPEARAEAAARGGECLQAGTGDAAPGLAAEAAAAVAAGSVGGGSAGTGGLSERRHWAGSLAGKPLVALGTAGCAALEVVRSYTRLVPIKADRRAAMAAAIALLRSPTALLPDQLRLLADDCLAAMSDTDEPFDALAGFCLDALASRAGVPFVLARAAAALHPPNSTVMSAGAHTVRVEEDVVYMHAMATPPLAPGASLDDAPPDGQAGVAFSGRLVRGKPLPPQLQVRLLGWIAMALARTEQRQVSDGLTLCIARAAVASLEDRSEAVRDAAAVALGETLELLRSKEALRGLMDGVDLLKASRLAATGLGAAMRSDHRRGTSAAHVSAGPVWGAPPSSRQPRVPSLRRLCERHLQAMVITDAWSLAEDDSYRLSITCLVYLKAHSRALACSGLLRSCPAAATDLLKLYRIPSKRSQASFRDVRSGMRNLSAHRLTPQSFTRTLSATWAVRVAHPRLLAYFMRFRREAVPELYAAINAHFPAAADCDMEPVLPATLARPR